MNFEPNWTPFCYNTFKNVVIKIKGEIFQNVLQLLQKYNFFSQGSDGWKSKNKKNFYGVNIDFISDDWEMLDVNLDVIPIDEPHITAEILKKAFKQMYQQFGIEKCEIVYVIDHGANIRKVTQLLGHKSIHCTDRVLQLPLKDSLVCINSLKTKCARIVQYFNQSSVFKTHLDLAQLTISKNLKYNPLVLKSDNETRWNSFLTMISRI